MRTARRERKRSSRALLGYRPEDRNIARAAFLNTPTSPTPTLSFGPIADLFYIHIHVQKYTYTSSTVFWFFFVYKIFFLSSFPFVTMYIISIITTGFFFYFFFYFTSISIDKLKPVMIEWTSKSLLSISPRKILSYYYKNWTSNSTIKNLCRAARRSLG